MKRLLAIPLALAAFMVSTDAHAVGPYTYFYYSCTDLGNGSYTQITDRSQSVQWPGTSYTLRLRSADFPTTGGNAFRRNALLGAIAEWNEAPQNLVISTSSTTSISSSRSDAYADDFTCSNNAPACAPLVGNCDTGLTATDIVFRTTGFVDTATKTGVLAYNRTTGGRDLRSVFMHELGHTLGLGHNNIYLNIMGDDIDHNLTQGPTTTPFIGGYGARAAALLYGYRSGAGEEITVSHWRRSGVLAQPEYSDHTPTRLYNSSNNLIGNVSSCNGVAGTFYRVTRGQTVRPGFAFENEGANPQSSVLVTFYLSTNDTIGPPDMQIGTTTVAINRGPADNVQNSNTLESGETKLATVIPSNAPLGAFFIGVHIDRDNRVRETDDDPFGNTVPPTFTGNSAYLQQRICITG